MSIFGQRKLYNQKVRVNFSKKSNFVKTNHINTALNKLIFKSVWKSSLGIVLSASLIQIAIFSSSNILQAEEAAIFLISIQLIRGISSFSHAPLYTKIPIMASMYLADRSEVVRIAKKSSFYSIFVFFSLAYLVNYVLIYYQANININVNFSSEYWFIMVAAFLIERMTAINLQLLTIPNKIVMHIVNGCGFIIAILFFLYFKDYYTSLAYPISFFLSYFLLQFPLTLIYKYKYFDKSLIKYDLGQLFIYLLILYVIC